MFTKLKAFTMAEAILVMTILGIIATIMISTLKPAEYKEKSMQIMAKKVLSELDVATTQILMNDTVDGKFSTIIDSDKILVDSYWSPSVDTQSHMLGNAYKKYLSAIRAVPEVTVRSPGYNKFKLKDGVAIGIEIMCRFACKGIDVNNTIFPGETNFVSYSYEDPKYEDVDVPTAGFIWFDINDNEPPNVWGKDQFRLPIYEYGILYAD